MELYFVREIMHEFAEDRANSLFFSVYWHVPKHNNNHCYSGLTTCMFLGLCQTLHFILFNSPQNPEGGTVISYLSGEKI